MACPGRQAKTIRHMGNSLVWAESTKPVGGSVQLEHPDGFRYHAAFLRPRLTMEFVLYLVLGACAGVLAGLFGVGGGLIIVPVLVYSFSAHGFSPDVLTQMAVGTSLATIVFT